MIAAVRRRLAPIAVLLVALVAAGPVAACGIPESTPVRVDGKGPPPGYGSIGGLPEPPDRLDARDSVEQFVLNFLLAAAGESTGAYERVNEYLAPGSEKPPEKQGVEVAVNVVRLMERVRILADEDSVGQTRHRVTLTVQQIGVLKPNGSVGPPVATETRYDLVVGHAAKPGETAVAPGLFVLEPPPVLLLDVEALRDYYQQHTIYFWNANGTALVPDLRYLPLAVPAERRATEVLGWLTRGPADWLAPAVEQLPEGTQVIGNAIQNGGRLEVNLSAPVDLTSDDGKLSRLRTQLAWSLPGLNGDLDLKIRNQNSLVIDAEAHRADNPLYPVAQRPGRYGVFAGSVHALAFDGESPAPVPIAPDRNRNIQSAAFAVGAGHTVALVEIEGDRRRLSVGRGPTTVTLFSRSRDTYAQMSRPQWLRTADRRGPIGLIAADGKLFRFGADAVLVEVRLPGVTGAVTAVATALDGRRLAVVADGSLYLTALTVNGAVVTAAPARRVPTTLTSITAVDWSGGDALVLGGNRRDERVEIQELTVDGVLETVLDQQIFAPRVRHLSALPENELPLGEQLTGRFMYEASGSFVYRFNQFEPIDPAQVVGRPEGTNAAVTEPFYHY